MDLSKLRPAKGAVKSRKRIGRGQGSGHGGTSTKGHKGDQSRSGSKRKIGFEGGQMPLQRRIPKRGFKNVNREEFRTMNLSDLQHYATKEGLTEFTFETFRKLKLVRKSDKIKVLGNGNLESTVNVTAHSFSTKAKEAIESKGGKVNLI
ncbi:MAG: 50S ribosomal protein L15 [Chitinophagales bacterium]|nr:50S ribosomal protein L15 [Chitinophagales bacterium]